MVKSFCYRVGGVQLKKQIMGWRLLLMLLIIPGVINAACRGGVNDGGKPRQQVTEGALGASDHDDAFAGAKWIALDADSTVIFPHLHLLKARSPEGQSLKAYELPLLTKTVELKHEKVKRAWVDICGMGQYELLIDGEKVGDYFLSPGWTMYDHAMLYNELDVTSHLCSETVELQVLLGGGMYDIPLKGYHKMGGSCGAPKLLFSLHVEYEDGTTETIVSDESWTAAASPIRHSSIYSGEWYDATFQAVGRPAVVTRPRWNVALNCQQPGTFVKIRRELPSVALNDSLYDFRQNSSGIVRIKVRGPRGSTVILRPAEVLKDGRIYQRCMPGYEWRYTLRGDAEGETWQPRFTYTGFRYVEVTGDADIELLELMGLHTSTDAVEAGSFECSDTLLNSIYALIDWAISSNLVSITTDCPTREKLGWQEQNHLMAYSMMYRYDMRALMNKIADDLADSQHPDGAIPTIAPEYTRFEAGSGFEDTPEWGASFILCPYYNYLWYGDDTAIRKHYDAMKRYIDYLQSRTKDGILDYGLGDWFDVGPERPGKAQLTSVALSATAMYYYLLTTMSRIAAHVAMTNGEPSKLDDARSFDQLAAQVKEAFNARFWDREKQQYEQGSQTASAMALFMNLTTGENHERVLQTLVDDIASLLSSSPPSPVITSGDVGFRYVLQALFEGHSELVWQMSRRDDIPGYAYQLKKGATALTESWQAYDNVSNNHLMLGHLMEWLFQAPGGIRQAEGSVAWRHIVIEPQMVGTLTWAKTTYRSPQGLVACDWTASPDHSHWTVSVTIPQGADAEVRLPDGSHKKVGAGKHQFMNVEH